MSEIILVCRPDDIALAEKAGLRAAVCAYRAGGDGRLYRRALPKIPGGSLMVVGGRLPEHRKKLMDDILSERAARGYSEIIADFQPGADTAGFASELAREGGCAVFTPEDAACGGIEIISTAISGGSLKMRISQARKEFGKIALNLEIVREEFSFPLKKHGERTISEREVNNFAATPLCCAFSPELCCKYMIFTNRIVLYDDAETVSAKLDIAAKLRVDRIFTPSAEILSCADAEKLIQLLRKYR